MPASLPKQCAPVPVAIGHGGHEDGCENQHDDNNSHVVEESEPIQTDHDLEFAKIIDESVVAVEGARLPGNYANKRSDTAGSAEAVPAIEQPHWLWRWFPLMLLVSSALGFSFQSLVLRQMTLKGFPVVEITLFRGILQAMGCLVVLRAVNEFPYIGLGGGSGMKEIKLLVLRAICGYGGIYLCFLSTANMPLAESAVVRLSTPIFSAVFAWAFLGERWHATEFIGSILAVVGITLVARPTWLGFPEEDKSEALNGVSRALGVLYGVLGSASASLAFVLIRALGTRVKVHFAVVMLWQAGGQVVLSIPALAFPSGRAKDPLAAHAFQLLAIGFLGFISQVAMTKGMQMEKVAMSSLARNGMSPVFAFVIQVLFLPSDPNAWTAPVGYAVMLVGIVAAIIGKARRESREAAPSGKT